MNNDDGSTVQCFYQKKDLYASLVKLDMLFSLVVL